MLGRQPRFDVLSSSLAAALNAIARRFRHAAHSAPARWPKLADGRGRVDRRHDSRPGALLWARAGCCGWRPRGPRAV